MNPSADDGDDAENEVPQKPFGENQAVEGSGNACARKEEPPSITRPEGPHHTQPSEHHPSSHRDVPSHHTPCPPTRAVRELPPSHTAVVLGTISNENLLKFDTHDRHCTVNALKKEIRKRLPPPITGGLPEEPLFPGLIRIGKNPSTSFAFFAFHTKEQQQSAREHLKTMTCRHVPWEECVLKPRDLQLTHKGQQPSNKVRPPQQGDQQQAAHGQEITSETTARSGGGERGTPLLPSQPEKFPAVNPWCGFPYDEQLRRKETHCLSVLKYILPRRLHYQLYPQQTKALSSSSNALQKEGDQHIDRASSSRPLPTRSMFLGVLPSPIQYGYRNHVQLAYGFDRYHQATIGFREGAVVEGFTSILPLLVMEDSLNECRDVGTLMGFEEVNRNNRSEETKPNVEQKASPQWAAQHFVLPTVSAHRTSSSDRSGVRTTTTTTTTTPPSMHRWKMNPNLWTVHPCVGVITQVLLDIQQWVADASQGLLTVMSKGSLGDHGAAIIMKGRDGGGGERDQQEEENVQCMIPPNDQLRHATESLNGCNDDDGCLNNNNTSECDGEAEETQRKSHRVEEEEERPSPSSAANRREEGAPNEHAIVPLAESLHPVLRCGNGDKDLHVMSSSTRTEGVYHPHVSSSSANASLVQPLSTVVGFWVQVQIRHNIEGHFMIDVEVTQAGVDRLAQLSQVHGGLSLQTIFERVVQQLTSKEVEDAMKETAARFVNQLQTGTRNTPTEDNQVQPYHWFQAPHIHSIQYHINNGKGGNCAPDAPRVVVFGPPTLIETLTQMDLMPEKSGIACSAIPSLESSDATKDQGIITIPQTAPTTPLRFEISPESFFQVNTYGAEILLQRVAQEAKLDVTKTTLLDICCGAGTIGLALANHVKKIIGIEIVPSAIQNARRNAERNGIPPTKATYHVGRVEVLLPTILSALPMEDSKEIVAIVDPPRAGVHPTVLKWLRGTPSIHRIVYISCDQEALKRDTPSLLKTPTKNYRGFPFLVETAFGVDLFPHTPHVEMVVVLRRATVNDEPQEK